MPDTTEIEARGKLTRLVFGHMAAQAVATAAQLGLADLIGDDECTAAELAEKCGTQTTATNRLLRALAALDLLSENEARPGAFSLTPAGALLRTDRPDSMHSFVRMFTDPAMIRAWESLEASVRTGRTSFDAVFGKDFFAHLKENPELSAQFNASMSQGTRATAAVLPEHYDFGRFNVIADVGGGDGTLLAAILKQHPGVRGILYDTAEGLAQAEELLRREGVADRCALHTGDFFTSVPTGADAYLLKSVIHDWDDDRSATILRHCREAMPDDGRLLLVEPILPETVDGSTPPLIYLSDLNMLVNVGGRERTHTDFETLFHAAGFHLTDTTRLPRPNAFALLEAAPA